MSDGVSIVIPFANRPRLHLLAGTLAGMRRCAGVDQIIVAEMGTSPQALDLARAHGADHVFTRLTGAFDKSRMMNAGFALARSREIFWCDCDFVFDPDFVVRAQHEMRACDADYFFPHNRMDYLGSDDTRDVLLGIRAPRDCDSLRTVVPMTENPGAMGMLRADFMRRHGGMIEGFRGWGCEDDAWLHKCRLLGKVEVSRDPAQRVWHLFHPDSGMLSPQAMSAALRRNPHHSSNARLVERIFAIRSGDEFQCHFPKPTHHASPWPAHARIAVVSAASDEETPTAARARDWAQRLNRVYGSDVQPMLMNPQSPDAAAATRSADAVVGFADDAAGCHTLMAALGHRLTLLVSDLPQPGDVPTPSQPAPMVLARTPAQRDAWIARAPAWHIPWQDSDAADPELSPPLTGPLSNLLGATRLWKVRIELDTTALPPPALDRPYFWYVGLHDADNVELARQDLGGAELKHMLADRSRPIVIERAAAAPLPPATWTVWPTDRYGRWLGKLTGPARAEDHGPTWT